MLITSARQNPGETKGEVSKSVVHTGDFSFCPSLPPPRHPFFPSVLQSWFDRCTGQRKNLLSPDIITESGCDLSARFPPQPLGLADTMSLSVLADAFCLLQSHAAALAAELNHFSASINITSPFSLPSLPLQQFEINYAANWHMALLKEKPFIWEAYGVLFINNRLCKKVYLSIESIFMMVL